MLKAEGGLPLPSGLLQPPSGSGRGELKVRGESGVLKDGRGLPRLRRGPCEGELKAEGGGEVLIALGEMRKGRLPPLDCHGEER